MSQVHDLTAAEAASLTPPASGLRPADLTVEEWREYDFGGRVYRVESPAALYTRPGGTTHRVVDASGIVHCLPAPGVNGCVLRWQARDRNKPVDF